MLRTEKKCARCSLFDLHSLTEGASFFDAFFSRVRRTSSDASRFIDDPSNIQAFASSSLSYNFLIKWGGGREKGSAFT